MRCIKNGAFVAYSPDWGRACDIYRCPGCHARVATGFSEKACRISAQGVVTVVEMRTETSEVT
jgi:hypothetical protein